MESIFDRYVALGYSFWFSSSPKNDAFIQETFGNSWIPTFALEPLVADWTLLGVYESHDNVEERQALLDHIIIADQFTRHLWRGHTSLIEKQTQLAIKLSEYFMAHYAFETREELLFVLLPLRHLPNKERIARVIGLVEEFMRAHPADEAFCARMLKATHKRWAAYRRSHRELARGEDGRVLKAELLAAGDATTGHILPDDPRVTQFRAVVGGAHDGGAVVLSLSGGVDSMVLACLLKAANVPFQAYHINYGRRTEATSEAEFLEEFCSAHEIPLTVEEVDPLAADMIYDGATPGFASQNWESSTRQKRFTAYLRLGGEGARVILGHHLDDTKENLLMNLFNTGSTSGGRYLWSGLDGMPARHPMRGVVVYRPLIELGVDKEWVWSLARDYNIPYFHDTSFELATRIRIRRELMPLMRDIFGARLDSQLMRIVDQSSTLEQAFDDDVITLGLYCGTADVLVLDIHASQLSRGENTRPQIPLEILKSKFIDAIRPHFFKRGRNLPSHISVRDFLERIRAAPRRKCEVFFRGHIKCIFRGDVNSNGNTKRIYIYF